MDRQVFIAEDRAGRPNDYLAHESNDVVPPVPAACPFCAGHERLTPESLFEATDGSGQWQVRVVPNKYPTVSFGRSLGPDQRDNSVLGEVAMSPDGAHEVFIESPRHVQDMTELSCAEVAGILQVYRDRLRYWASDERIEQVTLFKNVGPAAGASLQHIHSQLVALPDVSPVMAAELQGSKKYYTANRACIFCRLVEQELEHRDRLVVATGPFIAVCAYAGRQPYETWILPREHSARFERLSDSDTESLASILQQVVRSLLAQLTPLSYNLILHTAPREPGADDYYHWHFELIPRSAELAGFEWGTGMYINPVAPERAAARMRSGRTNS